MTLLPLPQFENILRPHQIQAARQVFRALTHGPVEYGYPGAVDLSDVGIGKSFIDLAAMACLRPKVIVIAPVAGEQGWRETFEIFGLKPHHIVSHQAVRGGWRPEIAAIPPGGKYHRWKHPDEVGIILDEAHFANGIHTQMAACIGGAIKQNIPIIAASASLAASPLHLRIAGRITGLHGGGEDWYRWLQEHHCTYDKELELWRWNAPTVGEKNRIMLAINQVLIPQRGCRVRKADCGSQAGSTLQVLPLEVPEAEDINRQWEELNRKLRQMEFAAKTKAAKVEVANYRRAARVRIWKKSEMALVKPVAKLIKADLAAGKSVVVFFSFTTSREAMGKILKTKAGLYGGQTPKQRAAYIAEFQANRQHILLNNITSGGASLSIQDKTGERPRVSYIFPTDKFTAMAQAPGRIDRDGGKTHSMQWIPCIAGGMSEKMVTATQKKLADMHRFNDGAQAGQRAKTKEEML